MSFASLLCRLPRNSCTLAEVGMLRKLWRLDELFDVSNGTAQISIVIQFASDTSRVKSLFAFLSCTLCTVSAACTPQGGSADLSSRTEYMALIEIMI